MVLTNKTVITLKTHVYKSQKTTYKINCKWLIRFRAVSETRTRDPQLGKLMLYQLSYYRVHFTEFYVSECKCNFYFLKYKSVMHVL